MVSAANARQSFKTAEAAIDALVNAAKSGDQKGILTVLGPDGAGMAASGDKVEDAAGRKRFIDAYDAKHQINMESDHKAVLVIGDQDWPFPIPIVRKDATVGGLIPQPAAMNRNERAAIQTSLAYVDAQNDYADITRASTGTAAYAQWTVSRTRKKDGLYWPTEPGESPSPLGELVASATRDGYRGRASTVP
jgi:Protein of unknown function (DUF2950)